MFYPMSIRVRSRKTTFQAGILSLLTNENSNDEAPELIREKQLCFDETSVTNKQRARAAKAKCYLPSLQRTR